MKETIKQKLGSIFGTDSITVSDIIEKVEIAIAPDWSEEYLNHCLAKLKQLDIEYFRKYPNYSDSESAIVIRYRYDLLEKKLNVIPVVEQSSISIVSSQAEALVKPSAPPSSSPASSSSDAIDDQKLFESRKSPIDPHLPKKISYPGNLNIRDLHDPESLAYRTLVTTGLFSSKKRADGTSVVKCTKPLVINGDFSIG